MMLLSQLARDNRHGYSVSACVRTEYYTQCLLRRNSAIVNAGCDCQSVIVCVPLSPHHSSLFIGVQAKVYWGANKVFPEYELLMKEMLCLLLK